MSFQAAATLTLAKNELAIGITHGAFGGHTGIAFVSAKDGQQILHLRWHKKLAADPFPVPGECWTACKLALPPALQIQLVGIVRAVAKRRPEIRYAVDSIAGMGSFDANGNYKVPKGSLGLTCASLVTELFRAARAPLLKEATWPEKPENVEWANGVVKLLEQTKAEPDHIAAVKKSVPLIRIRPEEVGGAATLPNNERPADFEKVSAIAPDVMKKLHEVCPPKPPAGAVAVSVPFAVAQPQNSSLIARR